jgi:hypothetical protein
MDNGQTGSIGASECSTDQQCEEILTQAIADRMSDPSAGSEYEVRWVACDGYKCHSVVRIDDRCFADREWYGEGYDCSLSDEAIQAELAAERERQATSNCAGGASGVTPDEGTEPSELAAACPIAVTPAFYPRDPNEWQGMLVDSSLRPYCEETANCGLSLSCLSDNLCGPCTTDQDCLANEGCVLDHCLLTTNISCRSYTDCPADALCILSGFDSSIRANETMTSYCNGNSGGAEMIP